MDWGRGYVKHDEDARERRINHLAEVEASIGDGGGVRVKRVLPSRPRLTRYLSLAMGHKDPSGLLEVWGSTTAMRQRTNQVNAPRYWQGKINVDSDEGRGRPYTH